MPSGLTILTIYLAVWAAISLIARLLKADRFGISGLPLYLIYRTSRFNLLIDRISQWAPTLWRTIWNLGIVTGVGSMVYIFYELAKNLTQLLVKSPEAVSVQPIVPLPGIFITFETFPYLILALSVVVVTHELSHGIASLVDRIPLKSAGAFFGHVLMGGFVEPDEEKLNQAKEVTKLRVFAAGSFTNIVLGVIVVLMLVNFQATITPFYNVVHSGVQIGDLPGNLPASKSGLKVNDILTSINGSKIPDISDLQKYMARVTPGKTVVLGTERGSFTVQTASDGSNSSKALIGIAGLIDRISYDPKLVFLPPNLPPIFFNAEKWLSLVLVSVALINMLPMYPFDGDKFLDVMLQKLRASAAKPIRIGINSVAYSILVLNIVLSLVRFGFLRY